MAYNKGWIKDKYKYNDPREDNRKWGEKPACPMRCCSKDWCEANGITGLEARHFKKLSDDLMGLLYWAGYIPTDFPSILHLLATFSSPDVISMYEEATKGNLPEKGMYKLLQERAIINKSLREESGHKVLTPSEPPQIFYRKLYKGLTKDWLLVTNSPINIQVATNGQETDTTAKA